VRRRHPEVVRIALSDRPDQQAALKLTGIAHQFLTDPCGPDELADVVERAVVLRRRLRSPALVELVSGLRSLPSMPTLHTEVVHLVMSPDSSLADIGKVISQDPGMSAKVLQLVNSAFFGLRQRITDPTLAVRLLGTNTLITLVLGVHIFTQGQASRGNRDDMDRLFHRAVVAAAASREIAHAERLGRDGMSDHHLAGMLHDIGKLVLATNFPDEFAGVSEAPDPLDAERRQFGATHEDVGAYLLGLWGLPDPIVEAAAFHHRPGDSPRRTLSPLTVVHLVSAVVDATPGRLPAIDTTYLGEVGIGHNVDAWMASVEGALGGG